MEFIRGLHNLRPRHRGCIATLGNFDGVHRGHQAVIGQLADKARTLALPTAVMLFEPQPQEFFNPAGAPARLMRLREKLQALQRYSVDRVLCMKFNAEFAALEPEAFIRRILIEGLDVRYLVVGDDFRFGHRRRGDFAMLQAAGRTHGFQVASMDSLTVDGERVSSTRIRTALAEADLAQAEKLLGRPVQLCGRVAHGEKLGRTLGVPTANIPLHRRDTPLKGIYAVEVFGLPVGPLTGVASLGTRPTIGGTRLLLEVHLFDFDRDIYGKYVRVHFLRKLRDEQRFDSLVELKTHIQQDIRAARSFFQTYRPATPGSSDPPRSRVN